MKIISLAGRRQVGKDSAYKFVQESYPNTLQVSFAGPLKEIAHKYFGVPERNLYGTNQDKDETIGLWKHFFNNDIIEAEEHQPEDNISARKFLQILGTECFRNRIFNKFWVNLAIRNMHSIYKKDLNNRYHVGSNFCITDCRFKNEFDALKEQGATMVKMYRDTGLPDMTHDSEAQIDEIPDSEFDYIITKEANKNLPILKETIKGLMEKLGW